MKFSELYQTSRTEQPGNICRLKGDRVLLCVVKTLRQSTRISKFLFVTQGCVFCHQKFA